MAKKSPGIYIAIRGDVSAFETDLNHARQIAKAQGEAIAKSIGNAVSKADLTGGITKLTRELKTAQAALSAGAFKAQVSGLEDIAKAAGVSSKQLEGLTNSMLKSQAAATANRAFEYLQKNAGLSTIQLAKLRAQLGDTSGALSTLAAGAKAHAVGILAFGAAAAMAGKQVLDASLQMDRLNKAYATITGSSAAAQNQLDYVYDVTQRLGLQFQGTAEAAKGFFAAGKDSALKNHLNGIFESVSMAGSALALGKDQMDGVFLALGQMISKGKVQAEELRGQLGERLPGAFETAARAMGVTTAKLDDMLKKGQVTAEEMLPKLAKVLHDDFAVAAAEASQGLQGQLNRLSTEWTRFQASLLDGDAAAKVIRRLASGMKVLADHGAELATIIVKGVQWAVWTAGIYAAIKALGGLEIAFTAVKAAALAVKTAVTAINLANMVAAAGPLAVVLGTAVVAFTALSDSTESTDEIFRKHQATIDDYKKRMGEAKESVESFSEAQRKAYKESLELQRDSLRNDIISALKGMNEGLDSIGSINFGNNFFQTDSRQLGVYRIQLEEINNQLIQLGKNVTRHDLDVWKTKVMACAEQVRSNGIATKEWTDFIIKLVGAGDSFYISLSAMIARGVSLEEALRQLSRQTDATKETLASGWTLNVEGVSKGIAAMEKSIRGMQAEMLGFKASKALVDLLPDLSPDEIKKAKDAFGKNGLEGALRSVGNAAKDWGVAQRLAFNDLLETSNALDDEEKKLDAWRKAQRNTAAVAVINLDELRKSVEMLEAANIPAAKSFDQLAEKIREQSKQAVIAIEADAARMVATKKLTAAQAEEWKGLKLREDAAKTTQKLREVEAKRADQDKKYADIRLDFEKRYADMVGLSSEAVSKSISRQAEEYRKAIEAGENAAEELVRLEEWKRDQMQRASREAMDGAQVALRDYQVEASNQAKSMNEAFKGLFDGMDSGWRSAWQQMIETGKVSLSSFRSLFASFLADLLHMAITRPITVQIAGVVSGMFGAGGVAQAAGGAGGSGGGGGLLGNIPFSSLLPSSWTSGGLFAGVAGTINGWGASLLPSTFASSSTLATAGQAINAIPGMAGTMPTATLLGTLGAAGAGFGLGSLAGSLLFPDRPGVSMGSGIGGGLGAAIGSVVPGIGTLVGGAVGSLFGGALGGIFGGRKPKRPAVWGGVEINLGDPDAYRDGSYNFGAAFDRKGYGKWDFEVAEGGYYAVATRDREKAGAAASQAMNAYLKQVADAAVAQAQTLQNALPEAYASQFAAGLSKHTIKASYDLKGSDISEEKMREIAEDLQGRVADAMFAVYRGMDFSEYAGKIAVDKSSIEGMTKFTQAVVVVDETLAATKELRDPTSEWVTAAKQAVAQMEAWQETMRSTGVTADYAASLMDEYRGAYRDNFLKQLGEMFAPSLSEVERQAQSYREAIEGAAEALKLLGGSEEELAKVRGYTQTAIDNIISALESSLTPLSAYEQAQRNANAVIDQHLAALRQLGASEGEIARVEALRAEAVAQATAELLRSFEQGVAQRWAALDGTSDEVGRAIAQENELREAAQKFGEGSAQVAELLKLHAAETAKAAEEAAKAAQEAARSEYDALKSQMDALEQQRVQLRQQAIQEEIGALNEQLSAAKTLRNTWEGLDKSLGQARYNLFAGTANLDAENRLGTVQAEFRRLSGLAMGGDSEAAGQLAGVGSSLLDLVKQTAGTEEDYFDAFWAVNAQLRNAQDVAGAQVSSADKQLEALQGQLDVQNAALEQLQGQSATLEEIEKQIAALRPLLEAAADKAGIKAFASGGLALPGWALVGEKGPELVNFSQPGRVYTAADTAALFRSATPRTAEAGSREEVKALREEVYQLRRDMNLLLNEIAKYGRRTSDTVEAWDAEGMPGVRA